MRLSFQGLFLIFCFVINVASAEDGYELWLRYKPVQNATLLKQYQSQIKGLLIEANSPTLDIVSSELEKGLRGLLAKPMEIHSQVSQGSVVAITGKHALINGNTQIQNRLKNIGKEGFAILSTTLNGKKCILITANEPVGLLYGAFHFLRLIQTQSALTNLAIESAPRIKHRILNHWDNLDRTVERGYAGFSLWDWHKLPDYIDTRYHDYARANASIGINGTVVTNVNANALILTEPYLKKVKALANTFRPYGIKTYLTARFSAPIEIGGLSTADPLDPQVKKWWNDKVTEIYSVIPDFGGFLVKANSEGQPGPQDYKRNHADGANMLAEALAPHGGIVMWRAFVYDNEVKTDRTKQAYDEFKPLDGKFLPNVIVQVKNGPLDFQPREPFHPMFGAMPKTPLMVEFQLTQEYLGFATHLVYLPTLFKETLDSDTHTQGKGSTVAKVTDGTLHQHEHSAIAGVANIGTDRNWCGHPFAQSNWYGFGRQAWDHSLDPRTIAEEWIALTFSNDNKVIHTLCEMMMKSRETTVNYMTPLGLHHIMGWSHHYGPAPWISNKPREDWTSVYYHKADSLGVGFDRTPSGSNALEQYHPEVRKLYNRPEDCPDEYLLWFHHLPWTYRMKSGRILWDEICLRYQQGTNEVDRMLKDWEDVKEKIDTERYEHVHTFLNIQLDEAKWWRDACLSYFQSFSKLPIPDTVEKPARSLQYYQSLQFPFAPGIRPGW
jgi:alpha-glucuronidase